MNVIDLFRILASIIPQEQHFDTLRHFIHYIIQVAGCLQNWSITWWQEDDEEFIQFPLVEFDEDGLWTDLKTHKKTDYVRLFNLVYNIFNNNLMLSNSIMIKNIPKKLVMKLPEKNG